MKYIATFVIIVFILVIYLICVTVLFVWHLDYKKVPTWETFLSNNNVKIEK